VLLLAATLGLGSGTVVSARTVKPEEGEGIFHLLERQGLSGSEYYEQFVDLNRSRLGPNHALILGQEYLLPGPSADVIEPLFGTPLERVKVLDDRLGGAAFYLVSGHGGPDPGGIARIGGHVLYEDEYAYDVTLRLGRRLMEHGAKVHFIIRDPSSGIRAGRYLRGNKSEVCYPHQKIPLDQVARLRQRAAAVNQLYTKDVGAKYRRCLVVHVDSRRKYEAIDIFFYHHSQSRAGRQLANTLRRTVEEKYRLNQPGRGYQGSVSTRNLYMLKETHPPAVFLELGNIHHPRDQERLTEPNNRQALANWLCEGILRDYAVSTT